MNVVDEFQKFQRARLKKAKKSDIDYMKSVYADTELFDITQRDVIMSNYKCRLPVLELDNLELPYSNFLLPFENCFIKVFDDTDDANTVRINSTVFIREHSCDILTGCVTVELIPLNSRPSFEYLLVDVPFTIKLGEKVICSFNLDVIQKTVDEIREIFQSYRDQFTNYIKYSPDELDEKFTDEYRVHGQYWLNGVSSSVFKVQDIFNNLNKHTILTDYSKTIEHYHFKTKPTKKVINRPIYYVLDKEKYQKKNYNISPITKLEYSHAFKVIGHWRKINGIGKDRKGNYHIDGFTWVNEYIKGEGELIKRIRVVK